MNAILKTSNKNYIAMIGGIETFINGADPTISIRVEKKCFNHLAKYHGGCIDCGTETDPSKMVEIHTAAKDEILEAELKRREAVRSNAQQRREWAGTVAKDPESYTIDEIIEAAEITANRDGWAGAKLLLTSSPFSRAMLAKFSTYSVTPFDDGQIIIKGDRKKSFRRKGGRFEGQHSFSDLLKEIKGEI